MMNDHKDYIKDFKTICRICLKEEVSLVEITEAYVNYLKEIAAIDVRHVSCTIGHNTSNF